MGFLSTIGSASARAYGFTRSAVAAATDAFFNRVTLLLNTSSTNGAQNNTFLDSSTNNFTITRNGNTSQGTFTPFSQTGWSNYFNGTGSGPYLRFGSSSALTFGTGDFTIEFWVNFLSINDGTVNYIYDMRDGGSGSFLVGEPSNTWTYINGAGNSVTTGMTSSTFSANQWYHVAICRASGVINFYVNGTKVSSNPADTSNYATSYISIMSRSVSDGANNNTNAYTSNFRIVKGTAVYTSNFTPSTTPLTAISGTSLLTCQANRFVDNSGNALTVAVDSSLSPSVQAFSPFAPTAAYDTSVVGGSGYFDGSGDYLTFTDSANDLDLGGLVASFEAWVYPTSTANYQHLIYKSGGALSWSASNGIEYAVAFDVNKFYFVYNVSGAATFINGTTTKTPYQWYHVVVATDASNNIALFVNGVREGTATNAITKPTTRTTINVGANPSGTETIYGYICGQRFIKGSGAYDPTQTTLTIPTAPPTAVTNTKLLLNYTNSGIYDSASKNVLETVGNAQVSTTQAKWGTTSLYCPATNGNYFVSPPNQQNFIFGTGNFTVEAWIYPTAFTNSAAGLIGYGLSGGYVDWNLEINTSGTVLYIDNDTGRFSSSSNLSTNAWTHIAIVRTNTAVTMYFNGVSVGSYSTINNITGNSSSARLYVGTGAQVPGSRQFIGYIDDPRISKYARYTANFTPPTAAFGTQ